MEHKDEESCEGTGTLASAFHQNAKNKPWHVLPDNIMDSTKELWHSGLCNVKLIEIAPEHNNPDKWTVWKMITVD